MKKTEQINEFTVKDTSRSHFTIIPNIVFDYELSPYDVRLYCELKRIAGEYGKCWMNTENLSKRCRMSTGQVSASKAQLVANNLITINTKTHDNKHYHEITIEDVWDINKYYTGSPPEPAGSPPERINITINKNPKTRSSESYKQDIQKSLDIGMTRKSGGLEDYPEEIREVLLEFVNLWKMKLPVKSQKSFWIIGGRELLDACGELGIEVLREVRKDFESFMNNHQGIAPFTVSSPKSLINPARAKAGWMRGNKKGETIIPQGASEVWIGGQRYT